MGRRHPERDAQLFGSELRIAIGMLALFRYLGRPLMFPMTQQCAEHDRPQIDMQFRRQQPELLQLQIGVRRVEIEVPVRLHDGRNRRFWSAHHASWYGK